MLFEDGSRAAIDLMEAKFEVLDKASLISTVRVLVGTCSSCLMEAKFEVLDKGSVVSSVWLVSRASLCLGGG